MYVGRVTMRPLIRPLNQSNGKRGWALDRSASAAASGVAPATGYAKDDTPYVAVRVNLRDKNLGKAGDRDCLRQLGKGRNRRRQCPVENVRGDNRITCGDQGILTDNALNDEGIESPGVHLRRADCRVNPVLPLIETDIAWSDVQESIDAGGRKWNFLSGKSDR